MAQTLGVRQIRRSGGRIVVLFTDKIAIDFNSVAELKNYAQSVEEDQTLLRKLLILYWLKRNDGSDPTQIEGKHVTFDLLAPTLLSVS
jgi:hypothetical protein